MFYQPAAASVYETDPRNLDKLFYASTNCLVGVGNSPQTAAFWNAVDYCGDYITTDPNGVTQTIVNVASGRGRFYGALGPASSLINQTFTFTITIDGTAYTIGPFRQGVNAGYRLGIGNIFEVQAAFTTAGAAGRSADNLTARNTSATINNGSTCQLLVPPFQQRFIKFNSSLKVEIISDSAAGGGANDAYSGAFFATDT